MTVLYYIFGALALVSGILVVSSRNPIHSVLFLIFAFLNTGGLLFLLGAEFLAFIFLIVYVGAVAVLFLFVVMILNINYEEQESRIAILPTGIMFGVVIASQFYVILSEDFSPISLNLNNGLFDWGRLVETLTNIEAIGMLLYTQYLIPFIVGGMVLLVAMVGAITLTLSPRAVAQGPAPLTQHAITQVQKTVEASMVLRDSSC